MSTKTDRFFEHSCRPDSAAGVCRSRGGESCAFDGAMIVLQCIADAAHLVHGPIACLGNSWESRGTVSDKGVLHRRSYTTDLSEMDIVYGAEEKLLEAIRMAKEDSGARAVFVYATCVSGLTGEDISAVCRVAASELGIRVIPVDAPGFVGPKNLGNRVAGDVLLEHVIGTGEPASVSATDINLIGEYNIAGDLGLVEPILRKAGFRLLSRITGNAAFEEIAWAHRARLNAVVCGRALINVAKEMQRRHGIPFVEVSFFGKTEMSNALRTIASALDEDGADLSDRVEVLIELEEKRLEKKLARFSRLRGKKAVLYTGGVKSWSIISALMDLGIEVVAVGTKKSTAEDEEKMKALLGPGAPLHENMSPGNILSLVRKHDADMLIAGGRNMYLAIKEGIPFVDVNQERHSAYAGYDGLVNLAEQVDNSVNFYSRMGSASPARVASARVMTREAALCINPLKHSASIGAAMAFQGIDRAMVVLHGAQGCNFLGKALLTKHFREPVSMVSTKLFVEDVVMGGDDRLAGLLKDVIAREKPSVAGVLTTGLTEVRGDDIGMALKGIGACIPVVHVPTPDYKGGLEEGYAAAVERLAAMAEPGELNSKLINILAGSALTPADINEIKETVAGFGLEAVVLPDLSAMDGSREGFSPLARGGATMDAVRSMGSALVTLAVGPEMNPAAEDIKRRCKVPYTSFDSLTGLGNSERFCRILSKAADMAVPEKYKRYRLILMDGMRDAAVRFGGKRIALALETGKALPLSTLVYGMGASVPLAVVPVKSGAAGRIIADRVVEGGYADLSGRFDLLIAGSHGAQAAGSLGIPHMEWGFPVFGRLGYNASISVGYKGTLELMNTIGNMLGGGK